MCGINGMLGLSCGTFVKGNCFGNVTISMFGGKTGCVSLRGG